MAAKLKLEASVLERVAGVDEAGIGPLAGPVVAAAVILPQGFRLSGLKDSKALTPRERSTFFGVIQHRALAVGVGIVDHEEIDRLNIFHARLKAMRLAVESLAQEPECLLVDGNRTIPDLALPQTAVVKGDTLHPCIMCASIIAKVTRDRWMLRAHREYPQYGFRRHKGYGTRLHLRALELYGPSPIHRKSFAPVKIHLHE